MNVQVQMSAVGRGGGGGGCCPSLLAVTDKAARYTAANPSAELLKGDEMLEARRCSGRGEKEQDGGYRSCKMKRL